MFAGRRVRVLVATLVAAGFLAAVTSASGSVGPAGGGPDGWEDVDDAKAGATQLALGSQVQTHTLSPNGDTDWFKFNAVGGRTYEIRARVVSGTGSNPTIYLERAPGNVLYNNDATLITPDANVMWECMGGGTYYFRVYDKFNKGGSYTVNVVDHAVVAPAMPWRVEGADRYAVAANVAWQIYQPSWTGHTNVIVASGLDRSAADAIIAAPLAGTVDAPILLVNQDSAGHSLPKPTRDTILAIKNGNPAADIFFYCVGGYASVPYWVETRISELVPNAVFIRLSGPNRYHLSHVVASTVTRLQPNTPTVTFVANGETSAYFFDALAASPVGYKQRWPILLTKKSSVPSIVSYEAAFYPSVRVVGNTTEVSDAVVTALGAGRVGQATSSYDRTRIARYVAEWGQTRGLTRQQLVVANKLPDALTGGTLAGHNSAGLLFPASAYSSGEHLRAYTQQSRLDIQGFTIIGGQDSVSGVVYSDLWGLTGWFE
jgi:hypothetical protein